MTDRPITRIISAEQALGICRAPFVGPNQRTLLEAPAPAPAFAPPPSPASNQPTLVSVHSAPGHPVREARVLVPNQPSIVSGVPRAVLDDVPTMRMTGLPSPQPPAAVAVALPPLAAMVRRRHAIALVVLASLGAALLTGGIVRALYEPRTTPLAPQPSSEPGRDAVLHPRP